MDGQTYIQTDAKISTNDHISRSSLVGKNIIVIKYYFKFLNHNNNFYFTELDSDYPYMSSMERNDPSLDLPAFLKEEPTSPKAPIHNGLDEDDEMDDDDDDSNDEDEDGAESEDSKSTSDDGKLTVIQNSRHQPQQLQFTTAARTPTSIGYVLKQEKGTSNATTTIGPHLRVRF